jgi:hypothetical protein
VEIILLRQGLQFEKGNYFHRKAEHLIDQNKKTFKTTSLEIQTKLFQLSEKKTSLIFGSEISEIKEFYQKHKEYILNPETSDFQKENFILLTFLSLFYNYRLKIYTVLKNTLTSQTIGKKGGKTFHLFSNSEHELIILSKHNFTREEAQKKIFNIEVSQQLIENAGMPNSIQGASESSQIDVQSDLTSKMTTTLHNKLGFVPKNEYSAFPTKIMKELSIGCASCCDAESTTFHTFMSRVETLNHNDFLRKNENRDILSKNKY